MAFFRMVKTPLAVVLSLACGVISGCGGGSAAVEGNVTLDGKPVDGGIIAFVPTEKGSQLTMRSASIIDGKYSLDPAQGIIPGSYRVDISWKKKTGKQIQANDAPIKIDEEVQVIPAKYNEDSRNVVTINSGANKFDYAISSKEGPPGGSRPSANTGSKSLRD